MSKTGREVWIGLVQVEPEAGNPIFDGAPGAYSNILGLACDASHYRSLVTDALAELGLKVVGFEDVELLEQRLSKPPSGDALHRTEFRELATELTERVPVLNDRFYVYQNQEGE